MTWGRGAIEQACAVITHASLRSAAQCCSATLTHPPLPGPVLILPGGKEQASGAVLSCKPSLHTTHRSDACAVEGQAIGSGR